MSLKAKLEAVIYAAEEPVTLNQLAALFAADALEWKAAQEAAAAEQMAEVAGVSPAAALPLIEQGLEHLDLTDPPAVATDVKLESGVVEESVGPAEPTPVAGAESETAHDSEQPTSPEVVSIGETEAYPSIVVKEEPAPETSEPPASMPVFDPESEAKRLARQKDREVKAVLKQLLDELIAGYEADARGVEIREIAGGYRMATKPECHDAVRLFVKSLKPAMKLSLPALETLAVIAYKQPVTAPEVNEIRGVESSGVLGSLLARKLIATAGRKPVIGRPILYKTTKEFLLRFGLKDVSELPSMEEFEKMAASELEMEPEIVEADKAEQRAEELEENAEADLESNSPAGEEMAGAAEAAESGESLSPAAESEPNLGASAESANPEPAREPESIQIEPATGEAASIESGATQETEATPHAESKEES
jgi:segregation and condensation protein B